MPTIQTKDLIGPALDWAVAKAEGLPLKLDPMGFRGADPTAPQSGWWVWYAQPASMIVGRTPGYSPSTDWAQGGPIIERERIETRYDRTGRFSEPWIATTLERMITGPTPLIAAMRCLVAFKLGPTVDIPDTLIP